MNSEKNSAKALMIPTAPLFASSWLALYTTIRSQWSDQPQRRYNKRKSLPNPAASH